METSYKTLREAVVKASRENQDIHISMGSHGDLITLSGHKKKEGPVRIYRKYFDQYYFDDTNSQNVAIAEVNALIFAIKAQL